MNTPADKTIVLTFASHPARLPELRWTAKLVFPPGSTAGAVLPIEIRDGNGEPVRAGVFSLAGQNLSVRDGAASVSYDDFIKGKHEVALWLYRPGLPPIPGGLTFA